MKELDSFTVKQLNHFIESDHAQCGDVAALARIALSAKQTEPDYYIVRLKFNDGWGDEMVLDTYETKLDAIKSKTDHGGEIIPAYTNPQLNSPVVPEGWIKCSDQMPENDERKPVAIYTGNYLGQGMFVASYDDNEFSDYWEGTEIKGVTHWMPLPAAPTSLLEGEGNG